MRRLTLHLYFILAVTLTSCINTQSIVLSINNSSSKSVEGIHYQSGYKDRTATRFLVEGSLVYLSYRSGYKPFSIYNEADGSLVSSCTNCVVKTAAEFKKVGNLIYLAGRNIDALNTLEVINVSNINNPISIGHYTTTVSSSTYAAHLENNKFYIGTSNGNVISFDISQPTPTLDFIYNASHQVEGIDINGNYMYIANGDGGIKVLDISNLSNITVASTTATTYADSLHLIGSTLYLSDWNGGVKIYDASNPMSLTLLGSYASSGKVWETIVNGSIMYVASQSAGVEILDISNLASPTLIANIDDSASDTNKIQLLGNTLYNIDTIQGLRRLNVTTPATASHSGLAILENIKNIRVDSMHIDGNRAYIANLTDNSIQVLNISNKKNPIVMGSFIKGSGPIHAVKVKGNYAYVAAGSLGLLVLDISDLSNILEVAAIDPGGYSSRLQIQGDYVFLGADTSTYIINISNPTAPVLSSTIATNTATYNSEINGNFLYLAENANGLNIYNISNPSSPILVGNFPAEVGFNSISVDQNVAYLNDSTSGVKIVNVSDPANPILISKIENLDLRHADILARQNKLYVGKNAGGTNIYSLVDINSPVKLTEFGYVARQTEIFVQDGYIITAENFSGFKIFSSSL